MSSEIIVKNPRPSKAERLDTIAESARTVFYELGYEGASVAKIAKEAGIAEGTIYLYFDGKKSLLYEVLKRHYTIIFEDIERTLPGIQGSANRLRYLIMRALHAIAGDRNMCGLITRELRQSGDSDQTMVHDLNRHYAALLVEVIREGKADGSFREDISSSVARDLIGGGLELIAWSYMVSGKEIDVEAVSHSVTQILYGGIETKSEEEESLGAVVQRLERIADRMESS